MRNRKITRRQVLAGAIGVGGIGSVLGTGTAAVATDGELFRFATFRSGTIELSISSDDGAGTTDGRLTIPMELTGDQPESTFEATVSLPDDDENNPAFAWVGTSCPDGDLARELEITISYADCTEACRVFSGTLADLAGGVPLDPAADGSVSVGEQECLEPGEEIDLEIDVDLGGFAGQDQTTVVLSFVGTQCRNTDAATNPFADGEDCDSSNGGSHAISFVAFCSSTSDPIQPDEPIVTETKDGGEPLAVEWSTAVDVDFVVVKASGEYTIYDHRGENATGGTVASGAHEPPDVLTVEPAGNYANDPCALASQEFTGGSYAATSPPTKLNYDEGDWGGDD